MAFIDTGKVASSIREIGDYPDTTYQYGIGTVWEDRRAYFRCVVVPDNGWCEQEYATEELARAAASKARKAATA